MLRDTQLTPWSSLDACGSLELDAIDTHFMPPSHQNFRPVPAVILLGIMLKNRCWPTTFHTITTEDADGWCQNWLVWSSPQYGDILLYFFRVVFWETMRSCNGMGVDWRCTFTQVPSLQRHRVSMWWCSLRFIWGILYTRRICNIFAKVFMQGDLQRLCHKVGKSW